MYAVRANSPFPIVASVPNESWLTSSKITWVPPPTSSLPRSPNRLGVKMPSSNFALAWPPFADVAQPCFEQPEQRHTALRVNAGRLQERN
jgi:hypothetical protein